MKSAILVQFLALALVAEFGVAEIRSNSSVSGGYNAVAVSRTGDRLVSELRSQVTGLGIDDVLLTDQSFKRYLQQSKSNVNTAVAKIQKTAEWRRQNFASLQDLDEVSLIKSSLPYECTGKTSDGNPVFYVPLGRWNLRKVQRDGQNSRLKSYLTQMLETSLVASTREVNPRTQEPVSQSVVIIDLQGFTLRQLFWGWGRSYRTMVETAKVYNEHYPDTVKNWYIIRAPKNFRHLWFFLRRAVPQEERNKFRVYSRFNIRWRNELRQAVPKSALPKALNL